MDEASKADHLTWCKGRALAYLYDGDLPNAVSSMISDLRKHPETEEMAGVFTISGLVACGSGNTNGVRRWIEGFH